MAKRRKTYRRRSSTSRSPRKTYRRRSKGSNPRWEPIAYGGYGVVRGYISNFMRSLLPGQIGNLSDEVLLGLTSWTAHKYGKGMVKKIGGAGLNIESYNFGRMVSQGGFNNLFGMGDSNGTTSGKIF